MSEERERSLDYYKGQEPQRGLSISGNSQIEGFRLGNNGALIFDRHRGTDAVFGVARGEIIKGTRRKQKNSGQGRR